MVHGKLSSCPDTNRHTYIKDKPCFLLLIIVRGPRRLPWSPGACWPPPASLSCSGEGGVAPGWSLGREACGRDPTISQGHLAENCGPDIDYQIQKSIGWPSRVSGPLVVCVREDVLRRVLDADCTETDTVTTAVDDERLYIQIQQDSIQKNNCISLTIGYSLLAK